MPAANVLEKPTKAQQEVTVALPLPVFNEIVQDLLPDRKIWAQYRLMDRDLKSPEIELSLSELDSLKADLEDVAPPHIPAVSPAKLLSGLRRATARAFMGEQIIASDAVVNHPVSALASFFSSRVTPSPQQKKASAMLAHLKQLDPRL